MVKLVIIELATCFTFITFYLVYSGIQSVGLKIKGAKTVVGLETFATATIF